ncbi:MAG: hypothetical protein HQL42_18310 [Alphaproteobacteria bacterium]|nr:hypothetical protein [Alphaproteobacteria bacterium]
MIKSQLGGENGYRHLLIYAHGGLNSAQDSAERTRALAPVLKANGIYPFMVMYETGFGETLKDLIFAKGASRNERAGGVTDLNDLIIEKAVGWVGARMWREMKEDAGEMFKAGGAGSKVLTSFMTHLADDIANKGIKLHFVGHSLGSVLIGHLLQSFLSATDRQGHLASLSLMAPACQTDFFNRFYADDLNTIDDFAIYNLSEQAELADNVGWVYRKSLLYLVSNAFEDKPQTPLAGMDKFRHQLRMGKGNIHIASESSKVTRSSSHGGFDNDPFTLNHLMGRVLGQPPKRPFTAEDLDYSGFPSWPSHFGTVVRAGQSGGTGG